MRQKQELQQARLALAAMVTAVNVVFAIRLSPVHTFEQMVSIVDASAIGSSVDKLQALLELNERLYNLEVVQHELAA